MENEESHNAAIGSTEQGNVNSQRSYSRSGRTGNTKSNTKSNISTNSNRNMTRNTNSRRSSVTSEQSGSEHENPARPAFQHSRSDTHKDSVRSVTHAPATAVYAEDGEVLTTAYDVSSLETAQQSEQRTKSTFAVSHSNSSKPPTNDKRRIMFGKIPRCFVINVEVILRWFYYDCTFVSFCVSI